METHGRQKGMTGNTSNLVLAVLLLTVIHCAGGGGETTHPTKPVTVGGSGGEHAFEGDFVDHPEEVKSQFIVSLDCTQNLLAELKKKKLSCQDFKMYHGGRASTKERAEVNQISCHFDNNITLFTYQVEQNYFLDIKNMSGGRIATKVDQSDHTEKFQSCEDLSLRIENLSTLSAWSLPEVETSPAQSHETITFLASHSTCEKLGSKLDDYISSVGRGDHSNQKVCVPRSIINQKNPLAIKSFMNSETAGSTNGIIILGFDIPPFELFYINKQGKPLPSDFAMTDLPYGTLGDNFWNKPLNKNDFRLKNKIYFDKNFMNSTQYPSFFAYDMEEFSRGFSNGNTTYRQDQWVSRIPLEFDKNGKSNFERYSQRRKAFLQPRSHNHVTATGSSGVLYWPGIHEGYRVTSEAFSYFKSESDRLEVLSSTNLAGFMNHIDPNTSFLHLNGHASYMGIDNVYGMTIEKMKWLPPYINLEGCYAGAWGFTDSKTSKVFISKLFSIESPPLMVIAAQAILAMPVLGWKERYYKHLFLNDWQPGESIGNKQKKIINENFSFWNSIKHEPDWKSHSSQNYLLQIFAVNSIFGDGSVKY